MLEMLRVVEEEYNTAEEEVVQLHEEEVAELLKKFRIDYGSLESERDVWRIVSITEGAGLLLLFLFTVMN